MLIPHLRQGGISGSEIASVCGIYPYGSPITVYEDKMGLRPAVDEWKIPPLVRGRLFERPLLEWYSLITQRTIEPCNTMVHPTIPLVRATPDGISYGTEPHDQVVVEAKNSSWRMGHLWGEEWSDNIPDFYLPQVMWEMAVTGLKLAHVVVYMGDEPKIYCVPWDEELFNSLLEIADDFWNRHILTRTPPPPEATTFYRDYLDRKYPKNTRQSHRIATDDILPWVDRLRDLRVAEKEIEAERLLVTNTIKEWVGDHDGMLLDGERIDFKRNKDSVKTDWKSLAMHLLQERLQLPNAADLATNTDSMIEQFTTRSPGIRPLMPRFKKGA